MRLSQRLAELRDSPRQYHLTVRARLTLTYTGLLLAAGAIMLTIVYVFIGVVPTYEFASTSLAQDTSTGTAAPLDTSYYNDGTIDYGTTLPYATEGMTTVAAVTVTSREDILRLLIVVSAITLVVLGVGGAVVGWVVAGRMLKPLQYVNAAAHRAAKGDLHHRIELDGPRDEIADLANTFDAMLGSLERSFGTYQRFAANASHELRTPLATSRAMIDVALLEASDEEKPLLRRLRETNERSIDTVEALLDLSEIDSAAHTNEPVNLHHLAEDALDGVAGEATEAGVSLSSDLTPAVAAGDPVLLRQLLRNLIENSIRHNERDGFVRVTTRRTDGWVTLTVVNSGTLVGANSVAFLTDPFYRDGGRTSTTGTANRGLGLSIVQAIIDRHGGTLTITPRADGGLIVTAELPAESDET